MAVIVNFWHLKNTNGMYWYALDYVRGLNNVSCLYARKSTLARLEADLPEVVLRRLSAWQYLGVFFKLVFMSRDFVYTPTPHPLPFLKRQMVVLHDPFPFKTGVGHIKRWLFFASAFFSRCTVGVVNRSVAEGFVNPLRKYCNIVFAPNLIAAPMALSPKCKANGEPVTIGLLGADSTKKKYESLFDALQAMTSPNLNFIVYGHATKYWHSVIKTYPKVPVMLLHSDEVTLQYFFEQVDCVVSVSKGEGFSRLIALAVVSGVPVYLTDDPVYREFYANTTNLFESPLKLLQSIIDSDAGVSPSCSEFSSIVNLCNLGWANVCAMLNQN
ncbi:glycosyltransferase family 1 protein [Teredinibacter turnerae]|uniref:glycosyltransferase family 1 protein n=1 Tax=Teredinibacter turnerae TaxID=2426 RepID=UPI000371E36D|nr:glycosyltransferase family 1 protein [Teredinibacter turnerae]